jgi:hypothetical protein
VNTVARPPEEVVADIAERLVGYVERYETAHDNRATFAYLYLQLTRTLATSLAVGDPAFRDPMFVADLAETLAGEYFTASDALDVWLASTEGSRTTQRSAAGFPAAVPEPWREVFAALAGGRSYVLEDALFSMMAHMSFDLPVALRRLGSRTDVTDHLYDYHLMNEVLGDAIDLVQDALSERYGWWLSSLDRIFADDDELFSNYGIRVARGMAWYNLCRLGDDDAGPGAEDSIRTSTGAFIRRFRQPSSRLVRIALKAARLLIPERRRWPEPGDRP